MRIATKSTQNGAVLVSGLIILGILLVIGASAVMMSNTQLKVAGNMQHQSTAMLTAESAIAIAENWLNTNYNDPAFVVGGIPGLYPAGATLDPLTMTWTDANSIKVDSEGKQRYLIELYMPSRTLPTSSVAQCNTYGMVAPCPKVNLYRISARGIGPLGATRIAQTIYAVRTTN